jgi:hypothetical protein
MKPRRYGPGASRRQREPWREQDAASTRGQRSGSRSGLRAPRTGIVLALALLVPAGPVAAQPGAIWERTVNGLAHGFDEASAVAVDGQGNVIVAGFIRNTGSDPVFTVAKFNRAGAPLW